MKKVICVPLVVVAVLLCSSPAVYAAGGPQGRAGVQGHADAREHGGVLGRRELHQQSGVRERHEVLDHHASHRPHGTRIFVAPGFWWGPDYPPYGEPPGYPPPQTQPEYYWYYCQDPPGYYPYVQQCPGGWQTVVPPPAG